MSLPPAEELSRWTVGNVNTWLSQSSLTAFRDQFLREGIDGSKLMRMQPHEIDSKYNAVPVKKRQFLKDFLSKIESPKSPASWNNPVPQLPPRPGRAPAPSPAAHQDDDSEDGWGSDFVDDIGSDDIGTDDEDYLEPTAKPLHLKEKSTLPGGKLNGHNQQLPPSPGEEPQSDYEIPAETVEERNPAGLSRRTSLVDRLKSQLQIRKRDSQVVQEATPPPRPPRGNKSGAEDPSYCNTPEAPPPVARHRPPPPQPQPQPQPPPPAEQTLPPDDVYEIVANESPREPEKPVAQASRRASRDGPLPPIPTKVKGAAAAAPVKQNSTERPLPPQPPRQQQQGGWLFNDEAAPAAAPAPAAAAGDDLSAFEWYHGKISRDHAQNVFNREQTDGMFLIRKSERDPHQPYTLVIWHCNRIWNIPIRKVANDKFAAGKIKDGENHFDSLPDLIEHFKLVSLNLKSNDQVQGSHNLTVPAPRQ